MVSGTGAEEPKRIVVLGSTGSVGTQTLDVVRRARFSAAFTFQYSPRPGTPKHLPKSLWEWQSIASLFSRQRTLLNPGRFHPQAQQRCHASEKYPVIR